MSRDARLVLALAIASLVAAAAAGVHLFRRGLDVAHAITQASSDSAGDAVAEAPADPILYAQVEQEQAAPPARFAAPLPRVQEFGDRSADRFPPPAHVRDLLCAGDADMWRRAREAIAGSAGATVRQVADTYAGELRYCPGDGCFAAALVAQGGAATAVLPAWMALASCPSAEADALFRRPDAPAAAVLARAENARWGAEEPGPAVRPPDADRLVAAAEEVLRDGRPEERRSAAFELARAGPKGVEALLARYGRTREPKLRRDLAMAMSEAQDPRARAIWKKACAADGDDPACGQAEEPAGATPLAPAPAVAPAVAGLAGRLQGLGLLPAGSPAEKDGDTAESLMLAAGRGRSFDTETGQFPNEHDSLLRSLAALGGDGLRGALFEEGAPPEDEEEGEYTLRAYLGGVRYQATARNLGDWFDVEAVVGLLNAVARDRKLEVRWLVLASGDQTCTVLAGPEKGLRDALAAELLQAGGPDEAMDQGKAFEEQAQEQQAE